MQTDIEKIKLAVSLANCCLKLERRIVGVKFLYTEEEFAQAEAREITREMYYCGIVKSAAAGNDLKVAGKYFACLGGARAIGVRELEETYLSGRHHLGKILYENQVIAKSSVNHRVLCNHKAYGVMIKPLECFNGDANIVIIITNPYNAMRVLHGYNYKFGAGFLCSMTGHQALCSECTAYPYEKNRINVSMLCGGTRNRSGWKDYEVGIGLPCHQFVEMIDGIYKTIDPIEPNSKKAQIALKLGNNGISTSDIRYNTSYWMRKQYYSHDGTILKK